MKLIEHFYGFLAPSICYGCGQEGSLLCAWCREEALPEALERCYKCNKLSGRYATCSACRRHSSIKHLFIRTEYSETAKQLVHKMKFKYSSEAADTIGSELASILPVLKPNTVIVPIPTTTGHVRQRGYDHAARIARVLSSRAGLLYVPALARVGQKRQVGATRRVRLAQVNGVFRLKSPHLVSGTSVLLVDDVLTTGATLEAAARELKAAGVRHIDAVVFAQAK